jgi:predicted RNase H-like nuclease (RuvC/YqgF family)|tara:strand:- start:1168 stop:1314 length:147 start_codon:yes stop_codon:yes gene_type:complete
MYHPLEVNVLHKHIETLKKQLEEREDMIKKLREELGRSGKTTWVENNV